jgi:hypothetical protein
MLSCFIGVCSLTGWIFGGPYVMQSLDESIWTQEICYQDKNGIQVDKKAYPRG